MNCRRLLLVCAIAFSLAWTLGCGGQGSAAPAVASANAPASQQSSQPPAISPDDKAPPPSQTGGVDGQRAYDYTAKLVSFGPRPSGSEAIAKTQQYIIAQLKSDGCQVDTDDFHAPTPVGTLAMKNIVAKARGTGKQIILLMTHYDTKRIPDFVGAEDGGSSTGLMLELARHICGKEATLAVWMAFVDGEEATVDWNTNNDHTYGSRELAARMELSGELKNVKAVILLDMIGQKNLLLPKDSNSTLWLTDFVWNTAAKLGYGNIFLSQQGGGIEDDHQSFLSKGVPAADIIDLNNYPYWHTPQDTMDKISPKSLAIVGYVTLASVEGLEKKFSK